MQQDITEPNVSEARKDDVKKRDDKSGVVTAPSDINPVPPIPTRNPIPEPPGKAADNAASPAKEASLEDFNDKKKNNFKTTGTKLHGWLTYGGVDWVLNSGFGVAFTMWGARTNMGKTFYTQPVQKVFRGIFRPLIKNEETLGKVAAGWNDFLSIMVGGTVVNPIITTMEKHKNKKAIAKAFDTLIHGKEKVENDPKFKKAYDEIDQEPVKNTRDVWIARGLAIAPLWFLAANATTRNFMKSNTTLKIPFTKGKYLNFDTIAAGTKKVAEGMGIRPKGWWTETLLDETTRQPVSHWQALHNFIAFDYGLTIPYAITHAFWYNVLAKFSAKKTGKSDKTEKSVAHTQHSSVSHDTTSKDQNANDQPLSTVSNISREAHLANVAQANQLGAT